MSIDDQRRAVQLSASLQKDIHLAKHISKESYQPDSSSPAAPFNTPTKSVQSAESLHSSFSSMILVGGVESPTRS